MARVLARQAANKVAGEGLALVIGAEATEPVGLADAVNVSAIQKAQSGLIEDMNAVADGLYGRKEN